MWLVLTLVVGAAPFDDVLTGPPAVQPRLPASPRVSAPDDDFTERWLLETELFGTTLKPNPADTSEPAGLWCTHQEKGAWLFLRDPRTPHLHGGEGLFIPVPPGDQQPFRVDLMRREQGLGESAELMLGFFTAGVSAARLLTSAPIASFTPRLTAAKSWSQTNRGATITCEAVGRDTVERAAKAELATLTDCRDLICLHPLLRLLGPWDERLRAHARALREHTLRQWANRRAQATTEVLGTRVVDAHVECPTSQREPCELVLELRSDTAFELSVGRIHALEIDAIDESGLVFEVGAPSAPDEYAPKQRRTVRGFRRPRGALALRLRPNWGLPVPLNQPTFALGSFITVTPHGCNAEVSVLPAGTKPVPRPIMARFRDGHWLSLSGSDVTGTEGHAIVGRESPHTPAWVVEESCVTKWVALEFDGGEPIFVMTAPR